jgi:large subunit ribosomal protein L10
VKKEDKQDVVERLRSTLAAAKGAYFADFQGMDVATATRLRNRCREAGVQFEVVKNTLVRRAVEGPVRDALDPVLNGPTAIATSDRDEVLAAKIIADFLREFERPTLKAGLVDGRVVSRAQAETLAKLPGREVLIARLAGGLRAPVQKLHGALSSPLQKLAMALKQVAEQKG